jgi:integrase
MSRKRDLPEYVHRYKSRHGQVRIYFRLGNGHPYHRIRVEVGTPEFWEVYAGLLKGQPVGAPTAEPIAPKAAADSFRWLCTRYAASVEFKKRDKPILEACCLEPIAPKDERIFADLPIANLTLQHLKVLRDRKVKAGLPEAANSRIKSLKRLCRWAVGAGHLKANPAADLEKVKNPSKGWPPWTVEDLEVYEARHPLGTQARLALEILVGIGCARVDAVSIGNGNVHLDAKGRKVCRYRRAKTANNPDAPEVTIPIPTKLVECIQATARVGIKTWLVTAYGWPFSAAGFGNKFGEWCRQAKVSPRAHGLRKTAAARYAERGATAHQLCAAFGWLTLKEAERYTQAASRRKMGEALADLL